MIKSNFFAAVLIVIFITLCAFNLCAEEKPLTFAEAGEMAAASSIELQTELAFQALREEAFRWGLRDYFPQITLSASEDDRVSMIGDDSFAKMYTVSVQQLLFDGGKMASARKIEKAQIMLQKNSLSNALNDTKEAAIAVYRQVLQARQNLEIKQRSLDALIKQHNILKVELSLGLALDADLLEADIMIENAKIEIANMEIDLRETERQFAELLSLEKLPPLSETIDVKKEWGAPNARTVASEMLTRNPSLTSARLSVLQKEEESKFASFSWIPDIRGSGNLSFSGKSYPLSHYKWSFGITVDFSLPWIGSATQGNYGEEGKTEKNAQLSQQFKLFPNPRAVVSPREARLALNLERTKYAAAEKRLERAAVIMVEKLKSMIEKQKLSVRARDLAEKKLILGELKNKIGLTTRLEFMKSEIEYANAQVSCVNAAVETLSLIREIEKMLALPPGTIEEL